MRFVSVRSWIRSPRGASSEAAQLPFTCRLGRRRLGPSALSLSVSLPLSADSNRPAIHHCQFARVVKGVDLRSTAGNCAWVRTPQLTFSRRTDSIPPAMSQPRRRKATSTHHHAAKDAHTKLRRRKLSPSLPRDRRKTNQSTIADLLGSSPRRQLYPRFWSALSAQSVEDVIERFLLRLHVLRDVLQVRRGCTDDTRLRRLDYITMALRLNG